MKKIMKKRQERWFGFLLAICMAVTLLPLGVLASEIEESNVPSKPVIDGFDGYDCYGTNPYMVIDGYTLESELPGEVAVKLSDGESAALAVTWELAADRDGAYEFGVQLPDTYELSEALKSDIANGKARLPWILAKVQETEENTIPKETESSPPVIVAFGTSEGSLTIPKGTLEAVLAQLPSSVQVTLEDGQTVDVATSWECTDDYENTEYERYTFCLVMPEGYVLGSGLTEWDLPYYEVNISNMGSKESRHSWVPSPDGTMTIDQALGATEDIVAYLEANAQMYLGTPYSGAFADPSASGVPGVGMNCTGFVGHVLMACGADLTPIVEGDMPAYLAKAWTNLSCWEWWLDHHPDIISYRFDSTAQALSSGILEKGDIIIYEPDVSVWNAGSDAHGNKADCHIGFFWGDDPYENKFWHSSHETTGIEGSDRIVYAGTNPGNQISQLAPKCVSYCYIVKTTHPERGYLQLHKTSGNVAITDGNGSYSLEGAVYGVYTDPQCTKESLAATLTTDERGWSQVIELDAGTYYVKETQASPGYAVDETCHTVEVTDGHTADAPVVVQSVEKPLYDSMGISITKIDGETGAAMTQGSASLAGAQFTIKFYDGYYTAEHLPETPARTWVIETKRHTAGGETAYVAELTGDYKVSGDDFYYDSDCIVLPLGTITVQETKAPEGYTLEGGYLQPAAGGDRVTGLYVAQIKAQGAAVRLEGGNEYIAANYAGRGGVSIQKVDADTGEGTAQGNASLSGAVYGIINQNEGPVIVHGHSYGKGEEVLRLTTDASGKARTAEDVLPFGDYHIVEIDPSNGYRINSTAQSFTISQAGTVMALSRDLPEAVIRGGVRIQKRDAETLNTVGQGNASLSGAVFSIINLSENPVYVDGKKYGNGETVAEITTDVNGIAQTPADFLPYGIYRITEIKPPAGYTGEGVITREFTIEKDGEMVDLTDKEHSIINKVVRGGVKVQKYDLQTGGGMTQGSAALEGAVFEITNMSSESVMVDGKTYASGQVVASLTTDKDGLAQTASDMLPFGLYKITEVSPPKGYLGEGIVERTFVIAQDGVIVDMTGADQAIYNQVIRGDFELTKIDGNTQNAMAGIPFKITSSTTGESHTITTDANGFYSSASDWNPHSRNTNGGKAEDGLWFGLDGDGNLVEVNDALGALPFDTYCIEELRCEANEDKALYTGTLVISRDGYTVNLGTIENDTINTPEIYTSAQNGNNGTAYGTPGESAVIIDTVAYTGLMPGETYTLRGTLMNADSGKPIRDAHGEVVTGESTFKAVLENGTVDVEFVFDASGLAGADVVVFEKLFYKDEEVAAHEDLEDEGQTIHFPKIGTEAADKETGDHLGNAGMETVTIIDTVTYTNLVPGEEYTVMGTIMDKTTGSPLSYNGQIFTAEKRFTAETADGRVELTFSVPGAALLGKTVVAFESVRYKGVEIGTHTDINDKEQTIHYPKIGTSAEDLNSGTHQGYESETVTIVDTVEYTHLLPDREYTVKGVLMDKETREPYLADGKKVTAQAAFTPEAAQGSVQLTFTFNGYGLAGHTLVVFETVYYKDFIVAAHTDINDAGQTVDYPEIYIGTMAVDQLTETHQGFAREKVVIVDEVTYKGVEPGREYTMKGILMDQETGEPYLAGGTEVTAQKTFTAEGEEGSVILEFSLDGSELKDVVLVVFEELYDGETKIAGHEDLSDENQTVSYPEITLKTEAKDQESGGHEATASETLTIIDTVSYTGLVPGREYIMKGILMDKSNGEAFLADGGEVVVQTAFTPETADGSVEMTFTFNGSDLDDKELVVFESLYYGDLVIGTHEDIEDAAQTVKVVQPESPTPETPAMSVPKTGIGMYGSFRIAAAAGLLTASGVIVLIISRKYQDKRKAGKK